MMIMSNQQGEKSRMKRHFIGLWVLLFIILNIRISDGQEPSTERDLIQEGFENLDELNVVIAITEKEEDKQYVSVTEEEVKTYIIKELNYRIPILKINQFSKNKLYVHVNIMSPYVAFMKMELVRNTLGTVWENSKSYTDRSFFIGFSDIEEILNSFLDKFVELYINAGNPLVWSNKNLKCPKDLLINIDQLFDEMRNEPGILFGGSGPTDVVLIDASCKRQNNGIELTIDYKTTCQSRSFAKIYIERSVWQIYHTLFSSFQLVKIYLKVYVIIIDEYGQEHLKEIEMDKSMYDKINWANMSIGMLENLLVKKGYWKWLPAMKQIRGM